MGEGVRSVNQSLALSSALPERSRTDIMESDSLLASLSADGEIQAVTCVANLPTGGLQELAYIYLGLHQIPKLAHLPPQC